MGECENIPYCHSAIVPGTTNSSGVASAATAATTAAAAATHETAGSNGREPAAYR